MKEDKSNSDEDENIVTLQKGVKCNSLAYKNAYKTKKPAEFINTISVGIYGREDLAKRCVRVQRGTEHLRPLSPKITEVIEEQFFNFLKVKGFTPPQMNDELEKLNRYHHNAISSAKGKLQRQQRAENEVQAALDDLQNQQNGIPLIPPAEEISRQEAEAGLSDDL